MLRDLLFGNATLKTFCHFIKITFGLIYFCLSNCISTRGKKTIYTLLKKTFYRKKLFRLSLFLHEVFRFCRNLFKWTQNLFFQILSKFIFREDLLLRVTNSNQIFWSSKFVFTSNANIFRRFYFRFLTIPFLNFDACS